MESLRRCLLHLVSGNRPGIGWLFALALLPGVLAASILFYDVYQSERAQLEQGALQTSRALSQAMEKDLAGILGKLQVLATAPSLQSGDLQTFYSLAQDVLATESVAGAIVLIDGTGQQILNTLRPFGSALPRTGQPELLRRVFATGRSGVSDLYLGGVAKTPYVALEVPVRRHGQVVYALAMGIPVERLNRLLAQQNLPAGWVASILDAQGTVIARSLNPGQTVGKQATPDLLAQMGKSDEATLASRNLEGIPTFIAFSRSGLSGWTLVAGMSRSLLYANLYPSLALACLTILAFLFGGMLLAFLFGRHVRGALQALGAATEAAAAGNLEVLAPLAGPREIAGLAAQFNQMQTARREIEAERRRLNRTLQLLSESNIALLRADSEEKLLPEICQLIVGKGGYRMAWVCFTEEDADACIGAAAYTGWQEGCQNVRVGCVDDQAGQCPTGVAIRTGKTQIAHYPRTAPGPTPWCKAAIEGDCQSCIALPLAIEGTVIGALMIYAGEPEAFGPEEAELLEKLAHNLAFGIERLRMRNRLASANRELQGFTYAASHDMKAPLARIISFSALLDRQYHDRLDGDGLLFLDFIRQNASRLMALIEDLLEHARIEQQVLHLGPVALQAAVQAVLLEKDGEIRDAGAEVHLDLPAATVQANPTGMAQVLRNLVENALKYSSGATPPVIEIGGRAGERVCFWVKDNGIGFDMAHHDHIFEIFRRLQTQAEYPGTGVGLALVKKAMERMRGRVWAESAPGRGATFFVELPAAR